MSGSMLQPGVMGVATPTPYLEPDHSHTPLPPPPMLRPPPLTRPPPLSSHEQYPQLDYSNGYDLPGGSTHDHSQMVPLSLTQEHAHRHLTPHQHHSSHVHLLGDQSSLDPYQDYYQSSTSRGFNAPYDHVPHDPRASVNNYNAGYHEYSGAKGPESDSYFYASTPLPSVTPVQGPSQYPARYHDDLHQSNALASAPIATHPPPPPLVPGAPLHQHYQPSPAVLLHIRYVMESICEWMQFTDVTLIAEGESFRAHRTILASHSTYLRQLLINNILDVGEGEEPCLVLQDVSSNHVRLLMQFFYTGMVSLTGQEDVIPLKEVCFNLGISSLMARLEELNISYHCLPNYHDSYKYPQPMASSSSQGPKDSELPEVVDVGKAKDAPESLHDTSFDSQVYPSHEIIVTTTAEDGNDKTSKTLIDEATSNFDTSLLNDEVPSLKPVKLSSTTQKVEAECGKVRKKAYACSSCSSKFYDHDGLKAHERVHRGKRPFVCSVCGLESATKHHLMVHMRKHSGEKPYICDICKKAFADQSTYKRHKAIHEARKSFHCEVCKKEFSDKSTFRRHQKERHGSRDKKFQCKVCEKEFNRRETFISHVTHVHGVEMGTKKEGAAPKDSVSSKVEIKEYLSETSVKKLDKSEKKWSSIKCPDCDMIFYKKSAMEVHLRSHTGSKPFVCEICGKKFARSNNLKLHTRIHSGEKPYKCSEADCGKAFSDISAFKRHVRTHTGIKPYKCQKCGRAFAQTGTMKNHEKTCPGGLMGMPSLVHKSNLSSPSNLPDGSKGDKRIYPMTSATYSQDVTAHQEFLVNSITEDNSLSVMAGSEPPGLNTDTLDSVRASCL